MADMVKTSSKLLIEVLFVDGDTRTITLRNPKSTLTSNDIENLETFMQTNNILIGDRDSSDFKRIRVAKTRNERKIILDLED